MRLTVVCCAESAVEAAILACYAAPVQHSSELYRWTERLLRTKQLDGAEIMMPLSARKGSWLVSEEAEQLLLTARRESKISDLIVCLLLTAFVLWFFSRFSPLVAASVMAVSGMCLWVWFRVAPRLKSDQNGVLLFLCICYPIVLALPLIGVFLSLRALLWGDMFAFSRSSGWLTHNTKQLARLCDIEKVEVVTEVTIKKLPARRETNQYFWLILLNGDKIDITSDSEEAEPLAAIIAMYLGCPLGEQEVVAK